MPGGTQAATVGEVVDHLNATYCGKMGVEFEHLESLEERRWWAEKLESSGQQMSVAEKRNALSLLTMAEEFEDFMAKKFVSFKRYSGEGAESMLPALDTVFRTATENGVEEVVVGMPHRGRLAFLVSMLDYSASKLFFKVRGKSEFPSTMSGSNTDDVTSHIAASTDRVYGRDARPLHVSLLHNSSFLEIAGSVAAGKARAKQRDGASAMAVQVHGDSAFSGQGCVAEGFSLSQLPGFTTGGSVHLIVNNQLGFTTMAPESRSSPHASDGAKSVAAPVLHVNGDSLDDVARAAKLATEYRCRFGKDVVIDLVVFRRHGHNEVDEPAFTQPAMYERIRATASLPSRYAAQLVAQGVVKPDHPAKLSSRFSNHLNAELDASANYSPSEGDVDAFAGKWAGMKQATRETLAASVPTGVAPESLLAIGRQSVSLPDGLAPHSRLLRTHVQAREKALERAASGEVSVDWATAEAMAMGSLMQEGYNVRLAGQDCKRGTFSQRHMEMVDQSTGAFFCPLSQLPASRGWCEVVNSNLSELAVLAFELGHSWESAKTLCLWEAQFGDFVNGAQLLIDSFLIGSEAKWLRQSGITLMLPHGYDGAGPEHSSARIERFLQSSDHLPPPPAPRGVGTDAGSDSIDVTGPEDVNLLVANCTTPANFFHLLRRQMHREFRKPLVVAGPKTMLRLPEATSSLADMAPGTCFQSVLPDQVSERASAPRRVLLVSGKAYYDLAKARAERGEEQSTAIVRVEELSPFPTARVLEEVTRLASTNDSSSSSGEGVEVVWAQEEPANMGAWSFARAHLDGPLRNAGLGQLLYVGRPALPVPAVGLGEAHKQQVSQFLADAFPNSSSA